MLFGTWLSFSASPPSSRRCRRPLRAQVPGQAPPDPRLQRRRGARGRALRPPAGGVRPGGRATIDADRHALRRDRLLRVPVPEPRPAPPPRGRGDEPARAPPAGDGRRGEPLAAQLPRRRRDRPRVQGLDDRRRCRRRGRPRARLLGRDQHRQRDPQEPRQGIRALKWLLWTRSRRCSGSTRPTSSRSRTPQLGILLSLFCGFFLYIGASDLLPESHHRHPKVLTGLMNITGAAVIWLAIHFATL